MIDLTTYDNKTVLQLVRYNAQFVQAVANKKDWVKVLNSQGVVCTPEQMEHIKKWVDKKS